MPFPNENNQLEYKEQFNEKLKKEIAAFLNGQMTGYIYLGVNDQSRQLTHSFTPHEAHQIEETISHWLTSSIYYPSPVGLVTIHTNNSPLCISVIGGDYQPYTLDGKVYIRNNSESVKASAERVQKMLRQSSLDTYDKSESAQQALTFKYLDIMTDAAELDFKQNALGFQLSSSQAYTNTAFLMSDQCDFSVKVAVFEGLTVDQFKDRKEVRGPIPKQIDEVLAFLSLNNQLSSVITGAGQRTDQQSYPTVAIREAVINAIAHRSYFSRAMVQIELFDDRLTIMSPGPLPGGLQPAAMLNGQSVPRNYNILNCLFRLKYIENYGTGMRRIFNSYCGTGQEPSILAMEDFVKLTLPNLNYTQASQNLEQDPTLIINPNQQKIIDYLKQYQIATRNDIQKLLKIKDTQANTYLKDLVTQGIIKKTGINRSTKYQLKQ